VTDASGEASDSTARTPDRGAPEDVLVPYDGSDGSLDAVAYALDVFPDADVTVLHVVDESHFESPYGRLLVGTDELRARADDVAEELLSEAREAVEAAGRSVDTDVEVGHPVHAILDYVDDGGFDQVVLGGRGLSNVPQLLIGSVSFGVVLHADVPVTVVR
jgi:nucleotide-binding universal stress UspA family protein